MEHSERFQIGGDRCHGRRWWQSRGPVPPDMTMPLHTRTSTGPWPRGPTGGRHAPRHV